VSLKSLLRHHPSGCQPAGSVGPTGPTAIAALFGGPTSPMVGVAAWPGPMSRATPPHCDAPPHCVAPPIVLHLLIVLLLSVLLILVHTTQDLDKGKYVNKFISTKYVTSSPCVVLNSSQCLLLLEELP
jgi:hypothetical protein